FVTLTLVGGRIERALEGRERRQLEQDVLAPFLERQRWFGAKGEEIRSARIQEIAGLGEEGSLLAQVDIDFSGSANQSYLLPLTILWGEENVQFGAPKLSATLARVRR